MNGKLRILIGLIGCLLLLILGIYRIFTNNLENMSLTVGYIATITAFLGFIAFSVKLFRVVRT